MADSAEYEQSISNFDPGVILVYSSSLLVEIEGLHCICAIQEF